MWRSWVLAGAMLLAGNDSAMAADPAPTALTLERIFGNPPISGPTPREVALSPDGRWLTSLRARADEKERYDLWAVDTATGQARMLVDSKTLGTGAALSEDEKMQRERARISDQKGIVKYGWNANSRSLLVPLDGDLYLATLDGKVRRLTDSKASELDGTASPAGGFVSFVRDQNLVVLDLATGRERALTRDGGGTLSWGVAEFVAQEEMARRRGHWWSPDDRRIAVARVDESKVEVVTRAAIGADGTKVYDQRYPKAGTPNAIVDLYVMAADGSGRVKVDLGGDPDVYLARVNWTADGGALLVQRESRDQKRLDMLRVEPATGKSELLFSETSKTWLNLGDDLRALDDGSLIWSSERDGFRHLYRWNKGRWTQLTKGKWVVQKLVGVDEKLGRLYFLANRETPIAWQLYAVDLKAPGKLAKLTEDGFTYDATMDKAATRLVLSRSSQAQPPQSFLADTSGKRIAWIEENRVAGDHPYAPFLAAHVLPEFGTLKADDGTVLQTEIYKPRQMQPGKRYPVIVQVYGGPGVGKGEVDQGWAGPLPQYWVSRGFIVFSLDNRGTDNRGKAFEDAIYRLMGKVEVADQLKGVAWLKAQPFVDPNRIVVSGWSYGGYMTLKLLEAAPGVFAAGIAGAPVTRWELYDTHYTERYLGNPAKDAKPYDRSDAITDADKIRDPLLLIHGMSDDNVVFDNSTALMAKLQAAAVPFEMMVYPGFGHRVAGPRVSVHLYRTIENFLDAKVGEADR